MEQDVSNDPKQLPKISVITAVRNGMPFVEQTVNSVIGQRNCNFEHIVIDGGSTDGTVDVIRSHAAGIAKWVSEKDEGISDAFNKGLSFATGDYILFLNADDALANPDILERIAGEIVKNDYPAMLYGDYDIIERNSGEIKYRGRVLFSHKRLKYGQVLPHPCLFTNRSYFERYGGFDTGFKIAMDYEWLLRGGLKERIIHVPMLVTNIRTGGISTLDQERAVNEIVLALKKNKYICSLAGEYRLRGYFFIRSFARKILDGIGLYDLFSKLRNRLKNG